MSARVLVTRAAEDGAELAALLQERGLAPVLLPCIAFQPVAAPQEIEAWLRAAPDLVVLSSPHAARMLLPFLQPGHPRLAAVGPGTAALLPGEVVVPRQGASAEALLAELSPRVAGLRLIVPRAADGSPLLARGLAAAGAQVEAPVLYRTITPPRADGPALDDLRAGRIDALTFASGSAVRGFVALAGVEAARKGAVVCTQGTACAAARSAGLRVDGEAPPGLRPLCDATVAALSTRRPQAARLPHLVADQRPLILIVDDDDDTRAVLQDLLELNGFSVHTCTGARAAVQAARASPPALMLLDYLMPDESGAWVVRALREAAVNVPIILTTGSNEGRDEAARLGVRSMEKPYDVSRLLTLIRSLVPLA